MARRKAEWGGRRKGAGRPAELVDPVRRWVLIERSDLEAALRLARKRGLSFSAIVRKALHAHGGYEVELQGDGFLLAFSSARRAVECAIAIQRSFVERNERAEEKIEVRAGLHTGEAIQDDGDFYGKHVNLAARIASQARGGQIFASSLLKELTDSGGDIQFDGGTEVELKGLTGTQRIYAIGW